MPMVHAVRGFMVTCALTLSAGGAVAQAHAAAQIPTPPGVPDGVRITVGAGAVSAPLYEGSARYGIWAMPIFKVEMLGSAGAMGGLLDVLKSFDARALDDISFGLVKFGGFEAGPVLGYRTGRSEKDSPRLRGLGDLEGGLVAGAYARYNFKPFYARVSVHQHVTGYDTGLLVRLAAGADVLVAQGILMKASAFMDFADNTYMDAYFGVSAVQSVRSGLQAFNPGAGAKSAGIRLSSEIALDPQWKLHSTVGYTRLLGDAPDSPIVESADRYEARLGLSRSFDWRWK